MRLPVFRVVGQRTWSFRPTKIQHLTLWITTASSIQNNALAFHHRLICSRVGNRFEIVISDCHPHIVRDANSTDRYRQAKHQLRLTRHHRGRGETALRWLATNGKECHPWATSQLGPGVGQCFTPRTGAATHQRYDNTLCHHLINPRIGGDHRRWRHDCHPHIVRDANSTDRYCQAKHQLRLTRHYRWRGETALRWLATDGKECHPWATSQLGPGVGQCFTPGTGAATHQRYDNTLCRHLINPRIGGDHRRWRHDCHPHIVRDANSTDRYCQAKHQLRLTRHYRWRGETALRWLATNGKECHPWATSQLGPGVGQCFTPGTGAATHQRYDNTLCRHLINPRIGGDHKLWRRGLRRRGRAATATTTSTGCKDADRQQQEQRPRPGQ